VSRREWEGQARKEERSNGVYRQPVGERERRRVVGGRLTSRAGGPDQKTSKAGPAARVLKVNNFYAQSKNS